MELDNKSVLRCDPQKDGGYTVTRVTFDTTWRPNGILVSQNQSTLYVAYAWVTNQIPNPSLPYAPSALPPVALLGRYPLLLFVRAELPAPLRRHSGLQ